MMFSFIESRTNQETYEQLHDLFRLLHAHLLRLSLQVSCELFYAFNHLLTLMEIVESRMIRALIKDDPIRRHEEEDIITDSLDL